MPLFPEGRFLPAALSKISDQHTTAKLFPQRLQLRVQATASVCVPGLRGQSTSQLGLWPQHWQDLGVLVTKPRLGPHIPAYCPLQAQVRQK